MKNLVITPEFLFSLLSGLVTIVATFFAVRGQVSDLKTRVDYIEKHQQERLTHVEAKQDEMDKKLDTLQKTLYEIKGYLSSILPTLR